MQTEDEIVETALAKLEIAAGLKGEWLPLHAKVHANLEVDGKILLRYNGKILEFTAEIKREFRPTNLAKIMEFKKQVGRLILVAEYIYPSLKKELREADIAYLETNGNVYLREDELWLWFEINKTEKPATVATGRAFAKTGLRLIFHFLIDDNLVGETYRYMAANTGVGFGNINFIMADLREQGFLVPMNKGTYVLTRKKELLDKWMQGYKERLKPALEIGTFRFGDPQMYYTWENLILQPGETWWGGEPAGALMTDYLKPEVFTLYTTEKKVDAIRKYRLIPDKKGNVKLYQKFWHFADLANTAPTLLVYTDLMNTNDRRCIETAEKIYHE